MHGVQKHPAAAKVLDARAAHTQNAAWAFIGARWPKAYASGFCLWNDIGRSAPSERCFIRAASLPMRGVMNAFHNTAFRRRRAQTVPKATFARLHAALARVQLLGGRGTSACLQMSALHVVCHLPMITAVFPIVPRQCFTSYGFHSCYHARRAAEDIQ